MQFKHGLVVLAVIVAPVCGFVTGTMSLGRDPDFGGIVPTKPITEEDLRQANYDAFVQEIIQDEDARIQAAAAAAAEQLTAARKAEKEHNDEVKHAQAKAASMLAAAQNEASGRLANSTADMVRDVAQRAALAGQRQQLAHDQKVIAELLREQAERSALASQQAAAQADQARLMAAAAGQVSTEMETGAKIANDAAEKGTARATADARDVWERAADATQKTQAAMDKVSESVLNNANAVNRLKVVAKDNLKTTREEEQNLAAASLGPAAFVKGVTAGMAESK